MITRFSVIPDERRLLLGVDKNELFKAGIVYEAREVLDQIILTPVGPYALVEEGQDPCEKSDIAAIAYSGMHLFTKEELKTKLI